jgi:hypothetical protein
MNDEDAEIERLREARETSGDRVGRLRSKLAEARDLRLPTKAIARALKDAETEWKTKTHAWEEAIENRSRKMQSEADSRCPQCGGEGKYTTWQTSHDGSMTDGNSYSTDHWCDCKYGKAAKADYRRGVLRNAGLDE